MKRVVPPFISPGGKGQWASQIIPLLPPHDMYLEPYAGGAGVYWRKPPVRSEVLGDTDTDVAAAYRAIQRDPAGLAACDWVVRQATYDRLAPEPGDDMARAYRFLYRAGASFNHRHEVLRRGAEGEILSIGRHLQAQTARMTNTTVLLQPAAETLRSYDLPGVTAYLDPPWPAYYKKWRDWQHRDAATLIALLDGMAHMAWLWDENPAIAEHISIPSTWYTTAISRVTRTGRVSHRLIMSNRSLS